jgi:hypothetical protein
MEVMFKVVVMMGEEESLIAAIPRIQAELIVADLSLPVAGQRHIIQ